MLKSFHWNDLKSLVWFTFQPKFPETFVNGKSFQLPFHSGGAIMVGCIRRLGWSEPNGMYLFIHLFLTLTSRVDASQKCIGSVTKDSFVSLVTNLKNKNSNCKQWCLLFQIETDESLTIWQWVLQIFQSNGRPSRCCFAPRCFLGFSTDSRGAKIKGKLQKRKGTRECSTWIFSSFPRPHAPRLPPKIPRSAWVPGGPRCPFLEGVL